MNLTQRSEILSSAEYQQKVKVALCDWVAYWASIGTESITDETLRGQTENMVRFSLGNIDHYSAKVAALVIADTDIKSATELTDVDISAAVTRVMASSITFLL